MSDTSLVTFKAIANFTNELSGVFGPKQHALKLYARLIEKTTITHEKPIEKHIEAFRQFCTSNRNAIMSKDSDLITQGKIFYSNRVFIDMKDIFKHADKETKAVIWKHLLTISALVDPASKAKQILKEAISGSDSVEGNFITDIFEKVSQHVKPDSNPMEAISSIMTSGVFTDLINGMGEGLQNGKLDLKKMMGGVQKMVSSLGSQMGDEENGAMNMINNVVGNMTKLVDEKSGDGPSDTQPDIMSMLGPMLNSFGGKSENGTPNIMNMLGPMLGSLDGKGGDAPNIMNMIGPVLSSLTKGEGGIPNLSEMLSDLNVSKKIDEEEDDGDDGDEEDGDEEDEDDGEKDTEN